MSEDPTSDDAALAALRIAGSLGAELQLLHVRAPHTPHWARHGTTGRDPSGSALAVAAESPASAELSTRLTAREREHGLSPGALTGRLEVADGHPARALLERAEQGNADWIFLGPHRKRHWYDFGNTARAVLHGTAPGVWFQPCEARPLRRLLVPVDGSALGTLALDSGCMLAEALGLELTVLHCCTPSSGNLPATPEDLIPEEFESYMAGYDWHGLPYEAEYAVSEPASAILARQQLDGAIVLGTSGHTAFAPTFLGHVAYSVLSRAETPVLAVRSRLPADRRGAD